MPTENFYATGVSESSTAFGGDVGAGNQLWADPELAGFIDENFAVNTVIGAANSNWIFQNLIFTTFSSLNTGFLTNLRPSYSLVSAKASLRVRGTYTSGNILLYTRVRSGVTSAAKGVREGGFVVTTGAAQTVNLHDHPTNPILCSRTATPLLMEDFVGAPFEIVVGFLSNGTTVNRTLEVDGINLELTWTAGPTVDRAPTCAGLLANRFRRFSRN